MGSGSRFDFISGAGHILTVTWASHQTFASLQNEDNNSSHVGLRSHEVRHAPHLAYNEHSVYFPDQILAHALGVGGGDMHVQGGSPSQVLEVGGYAC